MIPLIQLLRGLKEETEKKSEAEMEMDLFTGALKIGVLGGDIWHILRVGVVKRTN